MPNHATIQIEVPHHIVDELAHTAPEWMDLVPNMHVTLRYGVHDDETSVKVFEYVIRNFDAPAVGLGPLAQFTNLGTEDGSGVPVVSLVNFGREALLGLHSALSSLSSRPQDFPYTPHLTLCYAEPEDIDDESMGAVAHFTRFTATHATLIKRNGTRVTVPFGVRLCRPSGSNG